MNFLLIIGIFEALFLNLFLLVKKVKTNSDRFLGFIFMLFAVSITLTSMELYNHNHEFSIPAFLNLSWPFLFLHGPALWFYVSSVTRRNFTPSFMSLIHFIPFVIFAGIHLYSFVLLPAHEKIELVQTEAFRNTAFYKIAVLGIGISSISYNLWILRRLEFYQSELKQNLSEIERIDLKWLRILSIASLCCYGINVALFNLDLIFHIATYKMLMLVSYSFASIFVLVLGYFGLQHENVFISRTEKLVVIPEESTTKTVSTKNQEFVVSLKKFMNTHQPYLDPDITLAKLSSLLNVKPEYLSEVINSELNQNFFDFINRYRVEEFKARSLHEGNYHLSILGIAFDCGFNSKASFYRAFSKFENISPTAYIQRSRVK